MKKNDKALISMSLNQEKEFQRDLKIVTLNQVLMFYQVSLNQVNLTLEKHEKFETKETWMLNPKCGKIR